MGLRTRTWLLIAALIACAQVIANGQTQVQCISRCNAEQDSCRSYANGVYVTCGQQGGSETTCKAKKSQAEADCMAAAGCQKCWDGSRGIQFYCNCGNPFSGDLSGECGYTLTPNPDPCLCDPDGIACLSPIVIDVAGNGFQFTNAANGVYFDIRAIGTADHISWTAQGSDDAWLALDRNSNGTIDDGIELFGNRTQQPTGQKRNGFRALAEFDKVENGGNADGLISPADRVFALLTLWNDVDHNGVSEPSELSPLQARGIKEISLDYKEARRTDQFGNTFRYRAKVNGSRSAWDVFLRMN